MNFSLDLLDAVNRRDVVYYVIGSLEAEEAVNGFLWCSLIISVIAFVIGIIMKYSKKDCLINSIMTYMTSFVVLSLYNIIKLSVYITGGSTIKIEDVLWNKSALLIGVIIAVSIIVCALLFDKKKKLRMLLPIETLLISSIVIKSITYEWPTDKIVNDKVLLSKIINIITISAIIIVFKLLSKLDKNNSKKMVLLDYVLIIISIAISIFLLLFYKTI